LFFEEEFVYIEKKLYLCSSKFLKEMWAEVPKAPAQNP
jgi:hypothetical protein